MSHNEIWMGKPIGEMDRTELAAALSTAIGLLRSVPAASLMRSDVEVESALLHRHSRQDELIYVLEGEPTLVTDRGEMVLKPGMCAGFAAGGPAHHLVNRTDRHVVFLEVGDRSADDEVGYPADDIQAVLGSDAKWTFTHRDGTPY